MSVTVDQRVWSNGQSLDSALASIGKSWEQRYAALLPQLRDIEVRFDPHDWAARVRGGKPLRILGITSRFTTFLQYSMRDWADSFRSLGHDVQVLIESADHEQMHPLIIAAAAASTRPDLILLIDHFRAECVGLPQGCPAVMWVQDRLPNIFNASAGARQHQADYVLGQGRTECVHSFGYPPNRFMSSMIGTNPQRFIRSASGDVITGDVTRGGITPRDITPCDITPCDVSFVSHCSLSAEAIIAAEIARANSPEAARLLTAVFDQLKAIYDAGQSITQPYRIEAIINQSLLDTATRVSDPQPLLDLFTHRINNALYRHQAIGWVAEMGVNLRLYGRGWESHPTFSRFACGVADNESQLADIYRASAINLQITPFGAAHQRLFDGLAAGGFFLMRRTHGDRYDQIQRDVWQRCSELRITNDQQLLACDDEQLLNWIRELDEVDGKPILGRGYDYVSELAVTAREGFIRSAGTIWPEFEAASFDDKNELQQKIRSFLAAPDERQQLVDEMSRRVMDELTYKAISQRLLNFIADDLSPMGIRIAA